MIKIEIEGATKLFNEASEAWIHEQIRERQKRGDSVCVKVYVKKGNVDILLASEDCPKSRSSARNPNEDEQRIFDLWRKLKLGSPDINSGHVVTFVNQIKQLA